MDYQTFTERLDHRLKGMASDDLLQFGSEICRRLYPDYARLHQKHAWGDPDLILAAIRVCDGSLDAPVDLEEVRELRSRIDAVIPDTEDYGDFDGSYALNASSAVAYALQFILDRSWENAQHIAILYYDTMDFKVNESGVSGETEIECRPLIEEAQRFLLGE